MANVYSTFLGEFVVSLQKFDAQHHMHRQLDTRCYFMSLVYSRRHASREQRLICVSKDVLEVTCVSQSFPLTERHPRQK